MTKLLIVEPYVPAALALRVTFEYPLTHTPQLFTTELAELFKTKEPLLIVGTALAAAFKVSVPLLLPIFVLPLYVVMVIVTLPDVALGN